MRTCLLLLLSAFCLLPSHARDARRRALMSLQRPAAGASCSGLEMVTGVTTNSVRNDNPGVDVGMSASTTADITITCLSRYAGYGNSGTHTLTLYTNCVLAASVSVNMAGSTPGTMHAVALSSGIYVGSGWAVQIYSSEAGGAELWAGGDAAATMSGDFTGNQNSYYSSGCNPGGAGGSAYVGVGATYTKP